MAGERLPGFKIGLLTKVSYYNGNIWGKMLSSVASREPLRKLHGSILGPWRKLSVEVHKVVSEGWECLRWPLGLEFT